VETVTNNSADPGFESALAILVPEAEDLVGLFRRRFTADGLSGMPAHITLNYPFLPGAAKDGPPEMRLRELIRRHRPFRFNLAGVARWPAVLYLVPEPVEPFRSLARDLLAAFPDSPAYGGVFRDFVPHLTVAHLEDPALLDAAAKEFESLAAARLPVSCRAGEVWLLDDRGGRWERRLQLPLGG
jgi:2'-5' RNA ligase